MQLNMFPERSHLLTSNVKYFFFYINWLVFFLLMGPKNMVLNIHHITRCFFYVQLVLSITLFVIVPLYLNHKPFLFVKFHCL